MVFRLTTEYISSLQIRDFDQSLYTDLCEDGLYSMWCGEGLVKVFFASEPYEETAVR